jgi:hypothetical protein
MSTATAMAAEDVPLGLDKEDVAASPADHASITWAVVGQTVVFVAGTALAVWLIVRGCGACWRSL